MKKTIKLISVLLLTFLITTYSCKKDDEIVITLDDLEVTIDENPTDGQVIGAVQGNGSNTFTFSIDSQTPNGALSINANTGELTVADPMLFDFETNPVITATVSASEAQNTATVTINLNDVDEIVAQDVNLTIDENPSNGDIVGALQATAGSNLTYSISFQNPSGAFTINQSTGELSVADETLFDFETNPNMLATISISNGTYSVSKNAFVALNDIDNIASHLSTSLSAYNNANIGDWVIVTETEYDNIANNLSEIVRVGTTVSEYNSPTNSLINNLNTLVTVSNITTDLIPTDGYLIAFKYKVFNTTNASGVKVKISSSANNNGFSDIGNSLPTHSGNNEDIFFVLKGNNTPVNANSYLGFYQSTSTLLLFQTTTNGAYWGASDTSILNGQHTDKKIFYQGLSTTQIQW